MQVIWKDEKKVRINLYEAPDPPYHEQWVTPARAWFIVWPDWMYKSLRDKMGLVRSERDRGAQHNIICSSIIMASYLDGLYGCVLLDWGKKVIEL